MQSMRGLQENANKMGKNKKVRLQKVYFAKLVSNKA